MKQSPEFSKAMENMKPGVITAEGFLGHDHRPLGEIIEADEEAFAALGVEIPLVVERMKHLLEEGKKGLGEPITVEGKWLVRVDETRGHLPSPFGEDGIYRKLNAEVELLANGKPSGEQIIYNDLSIHLLEKYHFLEGKGSPFRLEPETIKKVLML